MNILRYFLWSLLPLIKLRIDIASVGVAEVCLNPLVRVLRLYYTKEILKYLRVVQTQAILFLKSISERGGSDIERVVLNDSAFKMTSIDFESI